MDIVDELGKVPIRINLDPTETVLKEAACTFVGGINGLGVAVKEVGKVLRNRMRGGGRDLGGF